MVNNDGFGNDEVAITFFEFCFRGRRRDEALSFDVVAIVVGKEASVVIVDAGEGDVILSSEGVED